MTDPDSSETFLYLTTTGHKTGAPHQIEIWFVEDGGRYYLVSEHRERSHWVQNIERNSAVTFHIGTRAHTTDRFRGTGRIVRPEQEPELAASVSALMDAKYDWSDGLIVELTPDERLEP